jgi:predicted nucleotide-binding protein
MPVHRMATTPQEELLSVAAALRKITDEPRLRGEVDRMIDAATAIQPSWCGSWIGYHARVYYAGFQSPPLGSHFSVEWGLQDTLSEGTVGEWVECTVSDVQQAVYNRARNPNLTNVEALAKAARSEFSLRTDELLSIFSIIGTDDEFLRKLGTEIQKSKPVLVGDYVQYLRPKSFATRDTRAAGQGLQTPPHLFLLAEAISWQSAFVECEKLAERAELASRHLDRKYRAVTPKKDGKRVFIGHGHSPVWRELKEFLSDRLGLQPDEFNRVSTAGTPTVTRLSEMLDQAAMGFLVLTADDEAADGTLQARMNVVHEAGLFQGRLGFKRAIILLEEGCTDFSNVHGLGHIPFPRANIRAAFEEIRRVLEREGLLDK